MQSLLPLKFWGGRRKGAGRKRGRNVQHLERPTQVPSAPVLVTLRARGESGNLREIVRFQVVRDAIAAAKERLDARIIHFSVQRDHVHLIVECPSREALTRAMKGLQVRIAKRINKVVGRFGCVFTDRFHARALKSPREIRNSLKYVLLNHLKHAEKNVRRFLVGQIDSYSSGHWFDGWKDAKPRPEGDSPVAEARSFLLSVLWKKHQPLISVHEIPGKQA